MISYIFKNKTKNILAIVFTAIYMAISVYSRVDSVLRGYEFSIVGFLNLLPCVLILVYLLTLEKQYAVKEYLFPAAFAIMVIPMIYTSILSTTNYLEMLDSAEGIGPLVYSVASNIILLTSYLFCIIGSIFNFKKLNFLKIGTLILVVVCVISLILQVFSLVVAIIQFKIAQSGVSESILIEFIKSNIKSLISIVAETLFYFGVFNLTLNRDGEKLHKKVFDKKEQQYETQFE